MTFPHFKKVSEDHHYGLVLTTTQLEFLAPVSGDLHILRLGRTNHQDTNPHQEHLQFQSMLGTIKLGPTYNSVLL